MCVLAALSIASAAAAQSIHEFPLPSVVPLDVVSGPDGNLWYTTDAGRVGRVTPAGVATELTPPSTGNGESSITAGPDGALWFGEGSANKIGRVTTAGAFTEFPLPLPGSNPLGITNGPDGALWFTEFGGNRIGRITTAGVITEFTVPTASSSPNRITTGPDSNLWFTERGTSKIGRLTTAGVFTEFTIPTSNATPEGIVAGADGNLWFCENSGGKIGRITPAGVLTEFPLPVPGRIFRIAAGPDGNLWFTEFDNNKMGRITPAGVITEYLLITAACEPYGITVGPDSNLWFIEFSAAKIGQFVIGGPPPLQIGGEFPATGAIILQDLTTGPDGALWCAAAANVVRMTTAGAVTTYAAGGGPAGIATGPDGNLWLAESSSSRIGRMTTSGSLTEYPVPGTGPQSITAGPDGALWFTESSGSKIGRITTAGAITAFPVPTANPSLDGIATGPDGNLWFTERSTNKIGRMTPAGAATEFPITTANATPEGITVGADGNLWFAENSGHKIGRVTTAGAITEFPLPIPGRVFRIAGGPDGNVWFTEFDGNRVGRITTSGVVTDYLIPTTDAGAYGITAGPDGNLWFSEFKTAKLGWVAPDPPAFAVTSVTPASGPAAGGTAFSIAGSGFAADATVMVALAPASNVSIGSATSGSAHSPRLSPGTLNDVVVTNPATGAYGVLAKGWLADFSDVAQSNPLHSFVEKLIRDGVTAGCGNGAFCLSSPVTRAQMSVFLLRANDGAVYVPPACSTPAFADVPCSSAFAPWIDELAARSVTAGCGGGNYCPNDAVTRGQMAVFLLRTKEGPVYTPPACTTPTFGDVPCSSPLASWIDELALRGITTGCGGGNFCPTTAVTRGQMAVFLVSTFALP